MRLPCISEVAEQPVERVEALERSTCESAGKGHAIPGGDGVDGVLRRVLDPVSDPHELAQQGPPRVLRRILKVSTDAGGSEAPEVIVDRGWLQLHHSLPRARSTAS